MRTILLLRLKRGEIAAACLRRGEMSLLDSVFQNDYSERTMHATARYLEKLLQQTAASMIVVEPSNWQDIQAGSSAGRQVVDAAAKFKIPLVVLGHRFTPSAFGIQRIVDRRQSRFLLDILWPHREH